MRYTSYGSRVATRDFTRQGVGSVVVVSLLNVYVWEKGWYGGWGWYGSGRTTIWLGCRRPLFQLSFHIFFPFFPRIDEIALATTPSTGCQVLDSWITPATIN